MAVSLYQLKKLALTPRTVYYRHRERDMSPTARQLFELSYYRRAAYEFCGATMANPDILVDLPIDASATVVDVGAFVGDWSQRVWDLHEPTIHAFEPAPAAYRRLARRFAGNERVHTHDVGLGGEDSTASLALAAAGSTIYAADGALGRAEVRIRDVAAVLDELGLDRVDVLKVNIEGGEYDLLDRLHATGWLARTDLVLVQFHEWHPNAYLRRRRNRRDLARTHDEVWGWSWVWELWRRRPAPA